MSRRLFVVSLALCAGCSFAVVKGPSPTRNLQTRPSCTSTWGMPLLDVISAGAIVAMGFSVASAPGFDCSSNNCRDSFDNSALITSAVIAAPWAISAFVGALRIDSCDAATATWEKAQPAAAAASTTSATTSATTSTPAP